MILRPGLFRVGWVGSSGITARTYRERVLATSPVAYWPMTEQGGTIAADATGNGYTGTYARNVATMGTESGPTLNQTAPTFDGTNDYMDGYSAGLSAAMGDMSAGTFAAWVRVASAGTWTDSTLRQIARITSAGSADFIIVRKNSSANNWNFQHKGGATTKSTSPASNSSTDWIHVAFTWLEGGTTIAYQNGVAISTSSSGVGAWSGSVSAAYVGAASASPAEPWSGALAHTAIWTRALSPAEISTLHSEV